MFIRAGLILLAELEEIKNSKINGLFLPAFYFSYLKNMFYLNNMIFEGFAYLMVQLI